VIGRLWNIARNAILLLAALGTVFVLIADPTSRPVALAFAALIVFRVALWMLIYARRRGRAHEPDATDLAAIDKAR